MNNWFAAHGDKLFLGVGATLTALTQSGIVGGPVIAAVMTGLGVLHTIFWPEPTAPTPPPK